MLTEVKDGVRANAGQRVRMLAVVKGTNEDNVCLDSIRLINQYSGAITHNWDSAVERWHSHDQVHPFQAALGERPLS